MPSYNDIVPSKYLKVEDFLGEDGTPKEYTLTIMMWEAVTMQDRTGADITKPVLWFRGKDGKRGKGFVLNKTNAGVIEANLKDQNFDNWIGKQITLGAVWDTAWNKPGFLIKVKPVFTHMGAPANGSPKQPAPPPPADIPADTPDHLEAASIGSGQPDDDIPWE